MALSANPGKYFGIYRGTVLNNTDPAGDNRVQVMVPGVSGQVSGWAMPSFQYNSIAVPKIGETVWVMYEAGDPAYPVYMGWKP